MHLGVDPIRERYSISRTATLYIRRPALQGIKGRWFGCRRGYLGPSQCWTGVVGSRSHGIPKALRGKTRRRLSSHNASASSWIRRFLPWPNQTAADPGPAQPRSPIYGQANSHARHGDTDHTRHGPDTQTGPHIIWRCVWISGVDFPAPSLLAPRSLSLIFPLSPYRAC
jgi:hypothetical protein